MKTEIVMLFGLSTAGMPIVGSYPNAKLLRELAEKIPSKTYALS
jgi:hypothetical protein